MMEQRIARLCRQLGVSRSVATSIAALAYGEGQQ
jgi:predicted transcriptional regulator